jgi:hypothetical protein
MEMVSTVYIYRVFPKYTPLLIAHNYLTAWQISLFLVSLSLIDLGEYAAPGGSVMKQQL